MNKHLKSYKKKSASQALVVVLLAVTLLSIIIVAFLLTASLHHSVSRQDFQSQAARAMATTGLNSALTQIRTALGPWDDPYNNFCGGTATSAPPPFYWSVSPGIITRWSYSSVTPQTNYPLFSLPTYGETNLVNLNAPSSDGLYPIIGGANPPAIQVYWANVLQNPSAAPGATNRIIGRYAFWVDDESAKINLNTADGTMKYQTNSLGLGTPSEVSLQALQSGGANISTTIATNLVYIARTTGFNSPREILRAPGATPDLYTNNVFNLTTTSRSPDLNIFGQPKMAMMPALGTSLLDGVTPGTNMAVNALTLQPLREIYPTPSQLPTYTVKEPFYNSTAQNPWPLTFRQSFGAYTSGDGFGAMGTNDCAYLYKIPNYAYGNGQMLANYLAGTNAMGQSITWPTFSGTPVPAAGFAGKYTPRQIDSIVTQMVSLGAKDISPDIFYITDPSGQGAGFMQWRGYRAITAPFMFTGWLSKQFVTGMGRTAKVDSLLMEYTVLGSAFQMGDVHYQPPRTSIDIWLEWWLPAAYQGGRTVLSLNNSNGQVSLGNGYTSGLNIADQSSYEGDNTQLWTSMFYYAHANTWPSSRSNYPLPQYEWYPASIPKADFVTPSYWSDQLLRNDQGMDIQGNPNNLNDPDQSKALQYHDPYAWTNLGGTGLPAPYPYPGSYPPYQGTNGTYAGTGADYSSIFHTPLYLGELQQPYAAQDWAPGELRLLRNVYGYNSGVAEEMKPSADGSTLNMSGGIVVKSAFAGSYSSDLDPVPLDAIRGNTFGVTGSDSATLTPTTFGDNGGAMGYGFDGESWSANAGLPSQPTWTVRDLALAAVIPAGASIQVPPNSDGSALANTKWVLSRAIDPLVNKFPGDWTNTISDTPPNTTMEYSTDGVAEVYWNRSTPSSCGITYTNYDEYSSGFHTKLADPDSYWMPQVDCAISYPGDLASQTIIPRSARMPNIGYLQYLRTGIIPDDEVSTPYSQQHGAPFRLVSYAPSTETSNQKTTRTGNQPYPDWTMLDLLYVPSILAPYGGPYGYYDTSTPPVWQGYGNPGTLANYSTGGGSTPGRINPNGAVIYSTNTTIPVPGVSRILPLQALLQGLMVNQSLNTQPTTGTASFDTTSPSFNPNPGWGGGSAVDAPTIAQAIYNYLSTNGPMRVPGELSNVPEIAALRPSVNATRNDLIRQVVGNLTTQSNVFSVWTIGQTVMKNPANSSYGTFQSGDSVLAESRFHFIIERYLDPGADGTYGNSSNPGPDGIAGTYDDPVDSVNHPFCPHYLYRVVAAEEIR